MVDLRYFNFFLFLLMCLGGAVNAEHFRLLSGGKPSRKCGIMSSGNHLFFSEDGLRMLVTNDMDISNARYSFNLTNNYRKPLSTLNTVCLLFIWKHMCSWLSSAGLFSSSYVLAAVKRLQIPALSRFCCSSLLMEVLHGDSFRNFSSVTAVIRLVLWPWRFRSVPAQVPLPSAGGNLLRTDTFIAHGSLTRYMRIH